MTNERALMDWLGSGIADVRLSAQADLARWLREERDPIQAVVRGMKLAPHAVTERQRRSYSALVGDIATRDAAILLVIAGNSEEIHGTVARRAFRRFCDGALPPDEAAALLQALEWCDRNRATEQLVLFVCERVMEAAVKRPTLELCAVQTTLETIAARRKRRVFGNRLAEAHFTETLESLKPLLPIATLPLPSHGSPLSEGNLPRPADGREPLAKNLPLAGDSRDTSNRRTGWWRR